MEIVKILKISYDGLKPLEKELFFYIACFWRGMEKDEVMEILDACGFHPCIGVKVLKQKALITTNEYGVFDMHDLVQEMGQYIVRGEHPNDPEKHKRLWRDKEINDMCYGNTTMVNVIYVAKAKKLRLIYLRIADNSNIEMPEFLLSELRNMYWENYPASPFPESFQPRKLVVLRLQRTLQEELWKGNKDLPCLKEFYLGEAYNLARTPDFGGLPCLQKITLVNCPKLKSIENNFHASKHLHKCTIIGNERGGNVQGIKLPKDIFHEHIHLEVLHLRYTRPPCNFYLPCFIRSLSLSGCGMKDGEIPLGIGELSNLQELDLSLNDFSVNNFSLLRLTRLKLLHLSSCTELLELLELPTSIAILKADDCESLELVVGDVIKKNCKWLSEVSFRNVRSVIGVDILLQTMLQGNAIENGCMGLELTGVEIPKGSGPPLLLHKGNRYKLELPENWYNQFSGFLMCATLRREYYIIDQIISLKHAKGGLTTCMDSQEEDVYLEEINVDDNDIFVRYLSFGSIKHTTWWDPTSTNIEFSFGEELYASASELISGFGVCLVSKTSETDQLQTTDSSAYEDSSYNGFKCNFIIVDDSRSHLKVEIS